MLNYLERAFITYLYLHPLIKQISMIKSTRYLLMIICLALSGKSLVIGQTENKYDFERIEDNSFLIEEAYNQEAGVIQHISSFQYMRGNTWIYTFTDEWPAGGQNHQLSATIPVVHIGETGFGDIEINYRYQAVLKERFAFSPRFSLLIPTGIWKKSLGAGVPGYQLSLPFSYLLSTKIVTHYNLGVTYTPNAKNEDGSRFDLTSYNYGLSIILLLSKNFNFMFEVYGNKIYVKTSDTKTSISDILLLNPGFRYAFNFKSGLQIVPGLAVPVGVGPSKGSLGVFGYLSFEHPLWKP
jgi:hypothetical protein